MRQICCMSTPVDIALGKRISASCIPLLQSGKSGIGQAYTVRAWAGPGGITAQEHEARRAEQALAHSRRYGPVRMPSRSAAPTIAVASSGSSSRACTNPSAAWRIAATYTSFVG